MAGSIRQDLPLEPAARGCPRPARQSSTCRVRRVTGWAGSSVHSGATEPAAPEGAGCGSWRRKPCARDGARGMRREWPTLAQGPAARGHPARHGAYRLGAGGRPQRPAWSVGGKQGLRAATSGVPILALSGPAIHERTGSPARVALSAARAGACVSEGRFSCRTARERARCGECGGERRGAAAHPLLPLRTRRRPEERAGRACGGRAGRGLSGQGGLGGRN